ncbi:MAG: hypothetical protein ACE37M_15645 [Henriciella sp.]
MLDWLKTQIRVIEAWREDVAARSDLDMDMITRLEHHYQWLTAEVLNLEALEARPISPPFPALRAV